MIDTIVKLWPVIAGAGVAAWAVFQWVYKRYSSNKRIEATKAAEADALAEQALTTARAQTDQAITDHLHTLEQTVTAQAAEIVRLNTALEVAHASEVEAWRRARGNTQQAARPLPTEGTPT